MNDLSQLFLTSGLDDKSQPLSNGGFIFRCQHALEFARTQSGQERTNGFCRALNAADTGRISDEIKCGRLRCADAKRGSRLRQLLCRCYSIPRLTKNRT